MSTLTLNYHRYTDRSWHTSTAQLLRLLTIWYQRSRQRHQLAQLTDRQLSDIGVNLSEALAESEKPFWQA